jgi:hypothetical protein
MRFRIPLTLGGLALNPAAQQCDPPVCKASWISILAALVAHEPSRLPLAKNARFRERRFPVVDEERGLVYSMIFFDQAGKITSVKRADGKTYPVNSPYDTPYTWMTRELFRKKNGKIYRVEAVLLPVPYGMPSGWGT